jgi:hypothetical protein
VGNAITFHTFSGVYCLISPLRCSTISYIPLYNMNITHNLYHSYRHNQTINMYRLTFFGLHQFLCASLTFRSLLISGTGNHLLQWKTLSHLTFSLALAYSAVICLTPSYIHHKTNCISNGEHTDISPKYLAILGIIFIANINLLDD